MIHVSAWDSVRAIDPGRGSVSDVQGINRMLEGIGSRSRTSSRSGGLSGSLRASGYGWGAWGLPGDVSGLERLPTSS